MKAVSMIFRCLTQAEFDATGGIVVQQNGSGQTYIDFGKSDKGITDAEMNQFFDPIAPQTVANGLQWDFQVTNLKINTTQDATIYARRGTTNSLRGQQINTATRLEILNPINGFPSSGYDAQNNPIIFYIIKDEYNNFWTGWFYLNQYNPLTWYVTTELSQIWNCGYACHFIKFAYPVVFDTNDSGWTFRHSTPVGNLQHNRKICSPVILYGPPGTGKTYEMQHGYIDSYAESDRFITTFHQSFSYEEFVEGLKASTTPNGIKYSVEPGVFFIACERAANLAGYTDEKDSKGQIIKTALEACIDDVKSQREEKIAQAPTVLLCIDEINRANVSAVFGDLISLIETSKRLGAGENEMTAILPYSKKRFGVPANLQIVGTMNTADRSIQLLDSALRRRFEFKELLPQYDKIANANARIIIENINLNICAILNKDHQIGHSYFIGVNDNADIMRVMVKQVIPLLEEYFYNNTDKIKCVLGERYSTENCFYVEDKSVSAAYKNCAEGEEKTFFKLNESYLSPNLTLAQANDIVNNFIKHLEGRF